jgi:hypothetical protein
MKLTKSQLREMIREEISKNRSDIKGTEAYKRAEWKARYGSMKGFDKAYPQYSKTSSTKLKEVSKKSKEASLVLQLMDKDYSYEKALTAVLNKYKNIDRVTLENELDKYI